MIFAALLIVIGAFGMIFPEIAQRVYLPTLKTVCYGIFFVLSLLTPLAFLRFILPNTFRNIERDISAIDKPQDGETFLMRVSAGIAVVIGIAMLINGG